MAIVKSGPYVGFSGTVDGITYCPQPDGTTTAKKKNTRTTKPDSKAQASVKGDTGIFSRSLKPLLDVINFGYALQSKKTKMSPWNIMVKFNRKFVLQGNYPDRYVDFSKVLITKGDLPLPQVLSAVRTDTGLACSWSVELLPKLSHYSDHVVMLAYFPELKEARYILTGALRTAGKDVLPLEGIKKGYHAHVYLAFITDDHKSISDSTYLGQFNW